VIEMAIEFEIDGKRVNALGHDPKLKRAPLGALTEPKTSSIGRSEPPDVARIVRLEARLEAKEALGATTYKLQMQFNDDLVKRIALLEDEISALRNVTAVTQSLETVTDETEIETAVTPTVTDSNGLTNAQRQKAWRDRRKAEKAAAKP
jgi:hypothetical protein